MALRLATTVNFEPSDDDELAITFQYDPTVVDLLKQVPARFRSYNPKTKTWRVDDMYGTWLASELVFLGYQVDGQVPE